MISQNSTVGFIGLGAMGQRIARRLLDSGFKLFAYDHTIRKTIEIASHGAIVAPSLRQLARKSDVVISCLPNDEAGDIEDFDPALSAHPMKHARRIRRDCAHLDDDGCGVRVG